ncbi:hypothetical protein [Rhodococcus sp. NPDC057529]
MSDIVAIPDPAPTSAVDVEELAFARREALTPVRTHVRMYS